MLDPERESERLSATLESLNPIVPARATLGRGDPGQVIPRMARRLEADVVVVGAQRQPDGWPGRVTDRVARADFPALLVVWP